ncbi:acyl carrier protein [Micromonospora eburnea]|uniref:Methoxymalonate biosynthesis acyl carrier protein n=1 Tax=Micromonospora eburnea TaxID=227316 RepID=A0A1C6UIL3_9ACTN|nr:phosphopantetheine-binding protein [Micromonospora eburnea]SCL53906.1 methoxymalonate biosynthesis acyl carrier protein [Micromonospora eburnea]
MTTDPAVELSSPAAVTVEDELRVFLEKRLKTTLTTDQDIFSGGVANSMFAMELVVHLERSFDVSIVGADLKMDNFRSIRAMTELVARLRQPSSDGV